MNDAERAGSLSLPVDLQGIGLLRIATAKDAWMICRLECACFGWERLLFGLWTRLFLRDTLVWIAEVGERPAGYVIAYPRRLDDRQMTYIGGVGVLPSLRRRGLGLALTRVVLKMHEAVWLHVRVTNTAAIQMYEQLGMVVVRQLSRFYSDGADAYVMSTVGTRT